jgi:plastocyanin
MSTSRLGKLPTIVLALLVPVVALAAAVLTLSVTDDATGAAAARGSGTGGAGVAVTIRDFKYAPNPIVVRAGATVTVTNDDATVHTLTADDGKFDTGALDGGASMTIHVPAPGTYKYHCDVHSYMKGTIEAR